MRTEISFCPLCAGKLDAGEDEQFVCEDCESEFFIQLIDEGDDDDEDEDEEEDEVDEGDEEEEEEEEIDDEDDE